METPATLPAWSPPEKIVFRIPKPMLALIFGCHRIQSFRPGRFNGRQGDWISSIARRTAWPSRSYRLGLPGISLLYLNSHGQQIRGREPQNTGFRVCRVLARTS